MSRDEESPRYHVTGEIAHGGMGVVLRAHDVHLGREVAMKTLRHDLADPSEAVRRFLSEAQICGQLEHPSIVPVHELGLCDDGQPYFTMKLVAGKTFADLLADRERDPSRVTSLLAVFRAVCQAIAYAHSRRVIHRDLKPSNVVVGAYGEVQVVDWGLAKILTGEGPETPATEHDPVPVATASPASRSQSGAVLGTPAYMAPEQARGEPADERADVFSLGGMLCEIITGDPPYAHGANHDDREPRSTDAASEALGGSPVDQELIDLSRACLAMDPGARPRDARAVLTRLDAYQHAHDERLREAELAAASAAATAAQATARLEAERRARRVTAALVGMVVLLTLASAGVAWLRRSQSQARQAKAITTIDQELETSNTHLMSGGPGGTVDLAAARVAAERASTVADASEVPDEVRSRVQTALERIDQAESRRAKIAERRAREKSLLTELERIRVVFLIEGGDHVPDGVVEAEFHGAFHRHQLDLVELQPHLAADALREFERWPELLRGVDEWCMERMTHRDTNPAWPGHLLEVCLATDPDPDRTRIRTLVFDRDLDGLRRWLAETDVVALPNETRLLAARTLPPVDAIPLLKASVNDAPGDLATNLLMATQLASAGQPVEARVYARAAVASRPDSYIANHSLGQVQDQLQDHAEATRSYRRAAAVLPDDAHLYAHIATSLGKQGRVEEALDACHRGLSIDPRHADVLFVLGGLHGNRGLVAEAESCFTASIAARPTPNAFESLCTARRIRGDFRGAMDAARRATELWPTKARLWTHYAGNALDLEEYAAAEEACHRGLALDEDDHELGTLLGQVLWLTGRYESAEAAIERALDSSPDHARAWKTLGRVRARTGDLAGARDAFDEAIRLTPEDADAYGGLGWALLHFGLPEEAKVNLERAVDLNPSFTEAWVTLGSATLSLEDLPSARSAFEEAARQDPSLSEAHLGIGTALLGLGDMDGAIGPLETSLELNPESAPGWLNLSQARGLKGEIVGAREAIQRALAIDPRLAGALLNFAKAHLADSRVELAIASLEEALAVTDGPASAWNNLGVAYSTIESFEAAAAAFGRAVTLDPEFDEAHGRRAHALAKLGRFDEAISAAELAVEHSSPARREAAVRMLGSMTRFREFLGELERGRELLVAGEHTTAIAHLESALALKPGDPSATQMHGAALAGIGDHERAAAILEEAVRSSPTPDASHQLAGAYLALGRVDNAITVLERAIDSDPDHAMCVDLLASTLATTPDPDARDPERAIRLARRALELPEEAPWDQANRRLLLGIALYRGGRHEEAERELLQAEAVGEFGDPQAWIFLAMVREQLGDHEGAVAHLERAEQAIEGGLPATRPTFATTPGAIIGFAVDEDAVSRHLAEARRALGIVPSGDKDD